jgi:hypothetical protein
MFHLLPQGPSHSHKIQNIPPCRVVLHVATLAVGKSRQQGVFEEFSTHLPLEHSIHGLPDKLAKRRHLPPHSDLAWSLPLTDATCVHKFFIPLSDWICGRRTLTFFWIPMDFKGNKNTLHDFLQKGSKPSAPYCKIYGILKKPYEDEPDALFSKFTCPFLEMFLLLRY